MGYGSLGHGLLTGAFTATTTFEAGRDWRAGGVAFGQPIFRGDNLKTNVGVVERLRREVAEPRGVPLSQIALAWVLANPAIRWTPTTRGPSSSSPRPSAPRSTGFSVAWRAACGSSPLCGPPWSPGARS